MRSFLIELSNCADTGFLIGCATHPMHSCTCNRQTKLIYRLRYIESKSIANKSEFYQNKFFTRALSTACGPIGIGWMAAVHVSIAFHNGLHMQIFCHLPPPPITILPSPSLSLSCSLSPKQAIQGQFKRVKHRSNKLLIYILRC